jgi:hypothetical protein
MTGEAPPQRTADLEPFVSWTTGGGELAGLVRINSVLGMLVLPRRDIGREPRRRFTAVIRAEGICGVEVARRVGIVADMHGVLVTS